MNEANTLQDILSPAGADWREKRQAFPADPQCPAPVSRATCPACGTPLEFHASLQTTLTNGTGRGFAPNGEG